MSERHGNCATCKIESVDMVVSAAWNGDVEYCRVVVLPELSTELAHEAVNGLETRSEEVNTGCDPKIESASTVQQLVILALGYVGAIL